MNEIIAKEFNEIFSPSDIEMLIKFDELEKRVKTMKDAKNESLKEFLKKNGLESYEDENIKITYVKPTERTSVDTEKLKAEGLYEMFTKKTSVKDSVRINIKYE